MELVTGEPLALDFVNTLTSEFDALDRPEPWLRSQAERLAPPARPLTEADLTALRALRGHIRAAVNAVRRGTPPPNAAIDAVNRAVRAAPAYPVLGADLRVHTHRDGDERARLLGQLAEAAVELLADPNASRIRACEGPDCRMLFLPAHPRRRWCSPALCGNRVRVARYYQRHRATGS